MDPNSSPPVCRLMDYNRLRYERKQRDNKRKAETKRTERTKEVRVRHTITEHDLNTKVRVPPQLSISLPCRDIGSHPPTTPGFKT